MIEVMASSGTQGIRARFSRCAVRPLALLTCCAMLLGGCSTLMPGRDYPRIPSVALAHPEESRLGAKFASAAHEHGENSGYRIVTVGADGFLTRVQMIDAAEKTLDVQYYIFRGDETGRLVSDALVRAADRGVRVRMLLDDGDTVPGDEQIMALDGHPLIEVRIFNPFAYRGHSKFRRGAEMFFNAARLDYRMHNKLMVADNTVALVGGRNVGNQYFQMDPESQFADDDVFSAGPIAMQLSATFDEYWNSGLAIPARALGPVEKREGERAQHRGSGRRRTQMQPLASPGVDYAARIATGEPYAGLISGRLPLVWAHAKVVCDSPEKKRVQSGRVDGRLMTEAVTDTVSGVSTELLIVTPYLIPAAEELRLLKDLPRRNVRVRVLTNSLESTPELAAHSGYMHFRVPLLENGVELYEVRSLLGNTQGSGQTTRISRFGNYSLHAKLFVFDRQKLFMGSMNLDQRSKHLNTEVGLIIESAELSQQTALRFEAMVRPENSYAVRLRPAVHTAGAGGSGRLEWDTVEDGKPMKYAKEPARSGWQRFKVGSLSSLPLESEL